jgi:hypothetical protein
MSRNTIVDLTLDSDDEIAPQQLVAVIDEDDDVEIIYAAPRAATPPPLIAMAVEMPDEPLQQPRVEVVTQPAVEVVAAQERPPLALFANAITDVPAFRPARDDTLALNDAVATERQALHAKQYVESFADESNFRPPAVVHPPMETLLLLERVSPLVNNRRTQFEHGDEFQMSDTFSFSTEPGTDVGAYQHAFAFTGGRYEIAPPVASLFVAGLVGTRGPPREATQNEVWKEYEMSRVRALLGAAGTGGLPTMFFEAALVATTSALSNEEFRPLYSVIERRGGTRFSAEVLQQTMDDVRASVSANASAPRSRAQFAGGADAVESESSGEDSAEEGRPHVQDSDGEELPELTETDERNLEHIRALLSYENVLLESVGVWRSRVSANPDEDGVYLVDDRVREYRLSAEDECYEFQYDSYVEMDDKEHETLEARVRFLPRGTDVSRVRLPRAFYEKFEIDETHRLGVKSVNENKRRPDVKNVLKQQGDPRHTRDIEVESRRRLIAQTSDDEAVGTIASEGKKRNIEEVSASTNEPLDAADYDNESDPGDLVDEGGSDKESIASDRDIKTMRQTLEEEGFGQLNLDETIAANAPARLDKRFTATTIAVPLQWNRSTALDIVRNAYQEGDPIDEGTPWWKTADDVWTAIVELALYEKLVPCFGPAFPEEARETLGVALELVLRRINAENQFLDVNRSNWNQLLRQQDELISTIADRLPTDQERAQIARLGDRKQPPLDTQPVLLRVCVPNDSQAFGFLPFIPEERETVAHIYALAGQQPVSAVDLYAAGELRIEADTCEPEANYYPFSSTYGNAAGLAALFNTLADSDDSTRSVRGIGALSQYTKQIGKHTELGAVDSLTLGDRIFTLYTEDTAAETAEKLRLTLRQQTAGGVASTATMAFISAVYPLLPVHNRVKPVFLAPPRLSRLSALRRAVQGPLFEEAFGAVGQFDPAALAHMQSLKDSQRAVHAHEQLENRGAERLFANAAQIYAAEHSAPLGAYVADQAPRVRTQFRIQPPDASLPEGIYRTFGQQLIVDSEATLRLLKSRASVGGSRIQTATVQREVVAGNRLPGDSKVFFHLCAPEVTLGIIMAVISDRNVNQQVEEDLAAFFQQYHNFNIDSLREFHRYHARLDELERKMRGYCSTHLVDRADSDHFSRNEFAERAKEHLLKRELMLLSTDNTEPRQLTTLPMSGMAALSRAHDAEREHLRSQLFDVYYRLAVDLKFKRLGYLATPFNTSTTLQLPTTAYSNYATVHLALTGVLRHLDADEDEDVDAMLDDADRSSEVDNMRRTGALELRTLRNTLEREIETLHNGRTLWFELSALCNNVDGFVTECTTQLVKLYTAVTTSRVAAAEPFDRRETDDNRAAPITLDPRAQAIRDRIVPLPPSAEQTEGAADMKTAGPEFIKYNALISAVQDAADSGEPLSMLLLAPEPEAPAAALSVNRLDLLDAMLGRPSEPEPPAKRKMSGVETLRARLSALARLDPAAMRRINDDDREEEIERKMIELIEKRRASRQAAVASRNEAADLAEPHGSHKRASMAGIVKAEQLVADSGQLTARQTMLVTQFRSARDMVESLEDLHAALEGILGIENAEKNAEPETNQRKLRLLRSTGIVLDRMLDSAATSLIEARLQERRTTLDTTKLTKRGASTTPLETQVAVIQKLLAERPNQKAGEVRTTRIGRRTISQFDVIAAQLLYVDVERVLARVKAQQLVRLLPDRTFRVRSGVITTVVVIPGIYVNLLLPAAIERARLIIQERLETVSAASAVITFNAAERPYALANRADVHPSLRIDELVRRYATIGELPLQSNNEEQTPYLQFSKNVTIGRLATDDDRIAALEKLAGSEQHVTFGEGVHRQHASGSDTQISALIAQLLHLFGTLHKQPTLAAVYQGSQTNDRETETIAASHNARLRLEEHVKMFFHGHMPTLDRMRTTDMRLLTLALLGFDTTSRTDNKLDNDLASDDDSPLATPSYVHMRANAAKRVLVDTYHLALIRDMFARTPDSERLEKGNVMAMGVSINRDARVDFSMIYAQPGQTTRTMELRDNGQSATTLVSHSVVVRRYEDNLRDGRLRANSIDAWRIDRSLLELPTVREQIEALSIGGTVTNVVERNIARAVLPRTLPDGFPMPVMTDQAWLLVPRITLIGALLRLGAVGLLMDALEKIIVILDDSGHLLENDVVDDAVALFVEQAEEVKEIESASSSESSTSDEQKKRKVPRAPVVQRNPVTVAPGLPEWRSAVEQALARLLRVERVSLRGSFGKAYVPGQLLNYEISSVLGASVAALNTPELFFASLRKSLILARFVVEQALDVNNAEQLPTIGRQQLTPFFDSDEVMAAGRTMSPGQIELAKMLVQAELHRRTLWRPSMDGKELQNTRNTSLAEAYRTDENAGFTVDVFTALGEAYYGNKKRSVKTVLTDYRAAHLAEPEGSINWRMSLLAFTIATTTKAPSYNRVERYLPIYDAIQLLFKTGSSLDDGPVVTNEQLHPLIELLAAPLTQRWFLRFRTEAFPETSLTSSRVVLASVYTPTYAMAYSIDQLRESLDRIPLAEVVAVHEFVFSTPAAPPIEEGASESTAPPTKKNTRQGHNYININHIALGDAAGEKTLADVLSANFSRAMIAGSDRFRQLVPLIGMPTLPLTARPTGAE